MRQRPRLAGTGLCRGPAFVSAAPYPAKRRSRSRLAADFLGRGAQRDRRRAAPHRRGERPRGGRLRRHDKFRHRAVGCAALGRPPDQRVRLAEQLQFDGDLCLASPVCPRLHDRHRHRHAGLRGGRLHPVVGPQSEHLAVGRRDPDRRGARSRRQADRDRPAPYRLRREGGLLAAGAAGHRCRAGARAGRDHDRGGLVRCRVRPGVDERPVPGARGRRPNAAR